MLDRALGFGVSRETEARLQAFEALLRKWNPAINLVAPSTIDQISERHIADSAQLLRHAPRSSTWIDLGSGAGFPGLIIAIIASGEGYDISMTLVESDARKATFLREAMRETETSVAIRPVRAEKIKDARFDVVSARALAPLDKLLGYAEPLLQPDGLCLFLKGSKYAEELDEARKGWQFTVETTPSVVGGDGAIVAIKDPHRV